MEVAISFWSPKKAGEGPNSCLNFELPGVILLRKECTSGVPSSLVSPSPNL